MHKSLLLRDQSWSGAKRADSKEAGGLCEDRQAGVVLASGGRNIRREAHSRQRDELGPG